MSSALIVVDVQNDFCEGGALAVVGGNTVASRIASYVEHLGGLYKEIVFTKDWHRPWPHLNGGHFSDTPDFVDTWPPHCEAYTRGSDLHPEILSTVMWVAGKRHDWSYGTHVFRKGMGRPDYSGFQGINDAMQPLHTFLHSSGIVDLDIVGIAGDYCVLQTAVDGKKFGYNSVNILPSLVASVGGSEATKKSLDTLASV